MSSRLSPGDAGSYSRPDEAVVKHMDIDLDCNFAKQSIKGYVKLSIETSRSDIDKVILDSRCVSIDKVENDDAVSLKYELGEPILSFGQKLTIYFSTPSVLRHNIVIYYTVSHSTAVQWLNPKQTAGKKFPYMFTQCQPDHCRSLIPCQDTPSVKFTYTAQITAPAELTVLMSAVKDGDCIKIDDGKKKYKFQQTIPIPSYLIALAVGNLEGRQVGPRSTVWSEPELIDAAAYEFAETEKILKTAEDICGPYVWKIYDILVLPPSFPFGGMENTCLTFITPTIVVGDRSLVTVVAHEIAHSWTGNLISIVNFEHFWLNEGFTMFIERKINGRLKGEAYRQFNAIGGLKDLKRALKHLGEENPFTKLVVNLEGIDPDDAFSVCPYEKGFTFLYYLEQLLGGPDIFEAFLRSYFEKFKYKSVTTEDFKNYLTDYFKEDKRVNEIEWDKWLYTPGLPYKIPQYDNTLQAACADLVSKWLSWNTSDVSPFTSSDLSSLIPEQIEEFASIMLETNITLEKVKIMDEIYCMSNFKNSEIKFRWLSLCINVKWVEKVDDALKFATEQGRMKYTRPIFRDLYEWEEMREKAINTFYHCKDNMMYVLVKALMTDLHLKSLPDQI